MGIKISALTPVVTPALSDVFPIVQAGVTYKESFTQLSSLFATAGANANITSMTGLTGYLQAPLGIKDANGNIVLITHGEPAAVNYVQLTNQATGQAPGFTSTGSDTDVGMGFITKNAGAFQYGAATNLPFIIQSGTAYQHTTSLEFIDSMAARTVTFPDYDGTIYLASKANGTEAANAVTASGTTGVITTSALTTAGAASYAITWTNTFITTASTIMLSVMGGTNTTQNINFTVTAGSGTSTLTIFNSTAATALNGTIKIGYIVIP